MRARTSPAPPFDSLRRVPRTLPIARFAHFVRLRAMRDRTPDSGFGDRSYAT